MDRFALAQELAEIADELDARGNYAEANEVSEVLAQVVQGMTREAQSARTYYIDPTTRWRIDTNSGLPLPDASEGKDAWWSRIMTNPQYRAKVNEIFGKTFGSVGGREAQAAYDNLAGGVWSQTKAPMGGQPGDAVSTEAKKAALTPQVLEWLKQQGVPEVLAPQVIDEDGNVDLAKVEQLKKYGTPAAAAGGASGMTNPLELGGDPRQMSIPELQQAIAYYRAENAKLRQQYTAARANLPATPTPQQAAPQQAATPPAAPPTGQATPPAAPPTPPQQAPGPQQAAAASAVDMARVAELAEIADELDRRGLVAEASEVDAIMKSMVRSAQAAAPAPPTQMTAEMERIRSEYQGNQQIIQWLEGILRQKMQGGDSAMSVDMRGMGGRDDDRGRDRRRDGEDEAEDPREERIRNYEQLREKLRPLHQQDYALRQRLVGTKDPVEQRKIRQQLQAIRGEGAEIRKVYK